MADRSRRMRRQISDVTEDSPEVSDADSEEFDPRKADATRRAGKQEVLASPASRSKRSAISTFASTGSQSNSNGESKQSIRLTMKVAPSKLREVMRANEVDSLKDTLGGGTVLDGPRSRRSATQTRTAARAGARPTYAEPRESDLEDDEEEDEEEEDDDEEEIEDAEVEEDTTMNDFDEIGAEAEGGTDDEDVEMEDDPPSNKRGPNPPKPPKITLKTPSKRTQGQPAKPSVIVTPADPGPVQSVEDEEMEDDPDDDELGDDSELPDNDDETNVNDEDGEGDEENLDEEIEGEGEDEELEDEEEDDEEDDDDDDDDELGDSDDEEGPGSGTATPDPAKMTSRQRGRPVEPLMALDMAPQQRKFFTDEEKAMKKDEHARKRKELTKRKTQEEKTAALNRLLKPQVSKTRGAAPKAETLAAQMQAVAEEEIIEQKADPLYTRWVSTRNGVKLGVPDEWLGKHVGKHFGPPLASSNRALIQEVE